VLSVVLVGEAVLLGLGVRVPAYLAGGFAMYPLAATSKSRQPYPVVAAALATVVASTPAWDSQTLETILFASGSILVGWLTGENAAARRSHALALAERAAEREREQARRTAIQERARIARELHDVVAHAMSVIAVRSGAARLAREREPDKAAEALGIIETISRRSLVELRRIVTVLREPDKSAAADLGPAPGLNDIPALVTQTAAAGVTVDVRIEGRARPLLPTEDLSAYRIAQEALTNVVRHSGAHTATLWVRYRPGAVEIECLDAGGPGTRRPGVEHANGGHGLVGMRERAALFGGELSAGVSGPGFRVLARLPVAEEAR
jgi:signal transduction histidine kinase